MEQMLLNIEILKSAQINEDAMNSILSSADAKKFIKHVIKTYTKSPAKFMLFNRVEYEDLMQLGNIGLYKGILDVDLSKNPKEVQRYLYLRIQGEVREVARSNGSNQITISQRIRGLYHKYLKFHNEFFIDNQKDPSIEEVMEHFSLNEADAYDLVYGMQATISDTVEVAGGSVSLIEILQTKYFNLDVSVENQVINRMILEERLCVLKGKERRVIELKYFSGYNNSEIARILPCSSSTITVYLRNAFETMRMVSDDY